MLNNTSITSRIKNYDNLNESVKYKVDTLIADILEASSIEHASQLLTEAFVDCMTNKKHEVEYLSAVVTLHHLYRSFAQ